MSVVEIPQSVIDDLTSFRFRKSTAQAALILKIDKSTLQVQTDSLHENISMDDIAELLPETAPRFLVLLFEYKALDGRIAYPLVFIYYSPPNVRTDVHMMYASSRNDVIRIAEVGKVFDIHDADELTTEWLNERLRETLTRA